MRKNLLFLIALLFSTCAIAQDFTFGQISLDDLNMKRYDKDTSAHAVVLQEYGTSNITLNGEEAIRLVYTYHVKIKIFDSRAFNWGTVNIRTGTVGDVPEVVDNIRGITAYIDDDGSVKTFELEKQQIYTVQQNKYNTNIKFALPGLKKGCVIEFQYTFTSPSVTFRPWPFQTSIPKLHSACEVHIPGFWNYHIMSRGVLKPVVKVSEVEPNCFTVRNGRSDCSHFIYEMNDIPAFVGEEYMTAPKNFISAIYFELSDYTNPYTGVKKKMSKEWADVDDELKHVEYFGGQLKRTNMLKSRIAPVIAGKTTEMDKAKAVYDYIRKTIKWNNIDSRGSDEGIDKVLEKHTGNAGDINLALITALNAAGINTEAVILSTRDNGSINKQYPTITEFDYVLAKINIAGKSFFLDATEPLIGFGILPLRCLNGEGRVVGLDKPAYWVDINSGQKGGTTYALDLTLNPDGKIKGTLTQYAIGYAAFEKRREIKKFNSVDEYVDNRASRMNKIKIIKSEIANLDSLEMPVSETYEIEFEVARNMNANRIAFNPFISDRVVNNPFKMAERNYPVNMGMPTDRRYILTMHLPEQYSLEAPLQPIALAIPNQGGKFISSFEQGDHSFSLSHVTQFTKSVYSPDEYLVLKELYNKIIQSEKGELYFRKN